MTTPSKLQHQQQQSTNKVSSNQVLRAVDNNRTNTKLTNKNNIINGKNQSSNYLNELNNNQSPKEQGGKFVSLASLFGQFTDLITLEELEDQNENLNSSKNTAILLNLNCDFTSSKSKWEAILYQNNLYLQIPAGVLFETSKEAFVNLLEYAEEELKCQNVLICLDKNSVEKCKYINNNIKMNAINCKQISNFILN